MLCYLSCSNCIHISYIQFLSYIVLNSPANYYIHLLFTRNQLPKDEEDAETVLLLLIVMLVRLGERLARLQQQG